MELFITVSGTKMDSERVKEHRFGRMEANTSVSGKTIRPSVKVDLFMLTGMFTRAIGKMIRLMAGGYMSTWMEPNTSEIGKMIDNMVMAWKLGQTPQNMKVIMNMVKNTVLELLNGLKIHYTLVSFTTIIFMGEASILGLIIENMKESGEQTKCMEKERLPGLMEESMLESMPKTRKRAMENSSGQMEDAIEENG